MPILARACAGCGHRFDVLSMGGVETNLDRDDDCFNLSCTRCGGAELVALVAGVAANGLETAVTKYPYFDRGLGRTVKSARHRTQICRELGVVPLDGETLGDAEDIAEKRKSENERVTARYQAYEKEMTEGPNRAEFHAVQEQIRRDMAARVAQEQGHRDAQRREYERELEAWERANYDRMGRS